MICVAKIKIHSKTAFIDNNRIVKLTLFIGFYKIILNVLRLDVTIELLSLNIYIYIYILLASVN